MPSSRLADHRAASGAPRHLPWVDLQTSPPRLDLVHPDGRRIRLHSARDPVREADRWLAHALDDATTTREQSPLIVLIGAGLGYAIDSIEARLPDARVIVLEPFAAAARAMLSRRDWHQHLESGRLHVLVGPDYDAPLSVKRLLAEESAPLVLAHPVMLREAASTLQDARHALDRLRFEALANAEAERRFAAPYLLNTLANLPVILGRRDVRSLFGRFRGTAAVLVGAGPSLDTNAGWLREIRDRAWLIAVDTALGPLLGHGIEPDFVVGADPGDANARHFAHVPALHHACLVAEGSLHPTSYRPFADRVYTFRVSNHHPWPFLRAHGAERGQLSVWGSVLTAACDLAVRMGCSPVVFTASDLAFTGGQPYCRGTAYEADWARAAVGGRSERDVWAAAMPESAIEVEDLAGRVTTTTPVLRAFRDWIVDKARQSPDIPFINATGAGILMGDPIRLVRADESNQVLTGPVLTRGPAHMPPESSSSRDVAQGIERSLGSVLSLMETHEEGVATDAWQGSPAHDTASAWLRVVERGGRRFHLAPVTRFALEAVTASLTSEAGVSDLRVPVHPLSPRSLTGEGMGFAVLGSSAGPDLGLFAPIDSQCPVLIREDGSWTVTPPWPRPLRGIRALGEGGRAVAWHSEGQYVMYRECDAAEAVVQDVSFAPSGCMLDSQGTLWWTCKSEGLWRGWPGQLAGPIVRGPSVLAVHDEGDALRLDPLVRDDEGRPVRTLVTEGLRYRPGTGELTTCDLGRYGQCAGASAGPGWVASPYTFADVVRVARRRDNRTVDLPCDYPTAVAWAGRSLIVATGAGQVLFFPMLAEALADPLVRSGRRDD